MKLTMQALLAILCYPLLVSRLVTGLVSRGSQAEPQKSAFSARVPGLILGGNFPSDATVNFLGREGAPESSGIVSGPKQFPVTRTAESEAQDDEVQDREPREGHVREEEDHDQANALGGAEERDHGFLAHGLDFHAMNGHDLSTVIVLLLVSTILFCCVIPLVIMESRRYHSRHLESRGFLVYLKYRFTSWFDAGGVTAASLVLLAMTMAVIMIGAILYWIATGEDPAHSMFRIFVWSTAASMSHREKSVAGRAVGILVTFCGLVILALLLGMVSEMFSSQMQKIQDGQHNVVEGGHIVVLGYSDCTKSFIEEIAIATEPDGGAFICILDQRPKKQVDQLLRDASVDTKNTRVDVRMGRPDTPEDLLKVAADAASQVVIVADLSVEREEADAKTLRTLLTITGQQWPTNGHIVVQCCLNSNSSLMQSLSPQKIEVVVVGDIVARLMVQSFRQDGLSHVFNETLGFQGSEFHTHEWPEAVGFPFKELLYRFDKAIPIGIYDCDGDSCVLNPEWDYVVKPKDRIIVIAEDSDTYKFLPDPYFQPKRDAVQHQRSMRRSTTKIIKISEASPRSKMKLLVVGWNHKIGMLLFTLEHMAPPGTVVEVYSPRSEESRKETLDNIQKRRNFEFNNLTVKQVYVPLRNVTARSELQMLAKDGYDGIFVLADVEIYGSRMKADETNVALLMQLKNIYLESQKELGHDLIFQVVAEVAEDATEDQLTTLGVHNFLNSELIVARALAGVAMDRDLNCIFDNIMSQDASDLDICDLGELVPGGDQLPFFVSFAEITDLTCNRSQLRYAVIGWTTWIKDPHDETDEKIKWVMNPTDKTTRRAWDRQRDRVVVIRLPHADFVGQQDHAGA